MSKLRRLAGETVLYGAGTFIPKMMNFLLVPLHTRIFHPEDYGAITLLYAFVGFLNILYTFGMETAYFRFATKPGADSKKIFNISQTTVVLISACLSVLFIAFASPLTEAAGIGSKSEYIVWLSLIMFIDASVAIPFARLRLEKRALQFTTARIGNISILIGLNLFLLLVIYRPTFGIGYVFVANLTANVFYLLFFSKTLLQWRPVLDKLIFRSMIVYAYPIMITGLAGMTNEMFSRITLSWWLPENFYPGKSSAYALGVFGACYKISALMLLTVQAFRFAAEPFFFSNAEDKQAPQLFARVNHYFIVICCIILLGVGINLDVLKYFLGNKEYWSGLQVVPILLLGYLFLGVYYNFSVWFKLTDRTHFGTLITLMGVAVTILLNFFLIPVAGYVGSSFATLGCYLVMAALCYFLGQSYYPIPYPIGLGAAYIVVTVGLVYSINLIAIDNTSIALAFHLTIILAFVGVALLFERKRIFAVATGKKETHLNGKE